MIRTTLERSRRAHWPAAGLPAACAPTPKPLPACAWATAASLPGWTAPYGLRPPVAAEAAMPCLDCGTVLSIERIEVDGDGNYVGTVAGGLLGAVLGSQIGGGEVLLRMADGRQELLTLLEDVPQVKVGDRVRLVDGALRPLVF